MKRSVDVWQKAHEIDVRQHSKYQWIAVGEYMGQLIEVSAKTEHKAARKWQQVAFSRGG